MAVVPSPGIRVTVSQSLINDLDKVSEWCDLLGMKLNESKFKIMIVSRSCTMHPRSPPLTIGRTVLKESDDLVMLGGAFDSKTNFEKHLHLVSKAASHRLGILRKSWQVFHNRLLLGRCFRGLSCPFCEYYCPALWFLAADTHLKLLDCAVSGARFLTGGVFECDISHHRSVSVLCMLYKIRCNPMHQLNLALPGLYVPVQVTRGALVAHWSTYVLPRCRTAKHLISSQCPSGSILLTPYSMLWGWQFSRAGRVLFYWPELFYLYYSLLLVFPLSSFCL